MSRRATLLVVAVIGLAGFALWPRGGESASHPAPAKPNACAAVTFEGQHFTECLAVPGKHRIGMRITGKNGVIYRTFSALKAEIGEAGVAFAMNGGMYDTSSQPIGYYVENRQRLYPLNTRDASGNFYLKPNGVLFGEANGSWRILTSEQFAAQVTKRPEFGTQSGPMLLSGGAMHPKISPNGTSLKLRNAVGVDGQGRAHFVISDEPVSFGTLARLLKDRGGCANALFLDGTVSALWNPASGRMDGRYPLGPLIVVTASDKGAKP